MWYCWTVAAGQTCLGKGKGKIPHLCGLAQYFGKGRWCLCRQHGSPCCLGAGLRGARRQCCGKPMEVRQGLEWHQSTSIGGPIGQLPCCLEKMGPTSRIGLVLPFRHHSHLWWPPQNLQGMQRPGTLLWSLRFGDNQLPFAWLHVVRGAYARAPPGATVTVLLEGQAGGVPWTTLLLDPLWWYMQRLRGKRSALGHVEHFFNQNLQRLKQRWH